MPKLRDANLRHAAHYEAVARRAGELYQQGGTALTSGLELFVAEFANISAGQKWAAATAKTDNAAAALCMRYPEAAAYLLSQREPSRERVQWLEAALAAASRIGDRRAESQRLGDLALAHSDLNEVELTLEYAKRRLTLAREIGDRHGEINALARLGMLYGVSLRQNEQAIRFYEQQLSVAREIGATVGEFNALRSIGETHLIAKDYARAALFFEKALILARENSNAHLLVLALLSLGALYRFQNLPDRALESYNEAVVTAENSGNRIGVGQSLASIGMLHESLGDFDRALEYFERELVINREVGSRRAEGHTLHHIARVLREAGRRADAISKQQAALSVLESIGDASVAAFRRELAAWTAEGESS